MPLFDDQFDAEVASQARAEAAYERHQMLEGHDAWNNHPDGCYWCGSYRHHSSDCKENDADDYRP